MVSPNSRALYTGITGILPLRVWQHKHPEDECFTQKYNISSLVYYEELHSAKAAIEQEKQIKGRLRSKKLDLIRSDNPEFEDPSAGWFESE
jgi:putative endonuclease